MSRAVALSVPAKPARNRNSVPRIRTFLGFIVIPPDI